MGPDETSDERRASPRVQKLIRVSIKMSEEGEIYAVTRDVSESGAFVLIDRENIPPVGETLRILLIDDPDEDEQEWQEMRVARVEEDGVGLFFVT